MCYKLILLVHAVEHSWILELMLKLTRAARFLDRSTSQHASGEPCRCANLYLMLCSDWGFRFRYSKALQTKGCRFCGSCSILHTHIDDRSHAIDHIHILVPCCSLTTNIFLLRTRNVMRSFGQVTSPIFYMIVVHICGSERYLETIAESSVHTLHTIMDLSSPSAAPLIAMPLSLTSIKYDSESCVTISPGISTGIPGG